MSQFIAYVRLADREDDTEWTKIRAVAGDMDMGYCEACHINTPHYIVFYLPGDIETSECWNCATNSMVAPVIDEDKAKEMGVAS